MGTDEHLAETPTLGLVHPAVSRAASRTAVGNQRILPVLDAKRAFLHADALGVTYVMPPHLRKTGKCWRLKKCIYGTLPAASAWQKKVACVYETVNMIGGKTTPCAFSHRTRGLVSVVHGDDFITAGPARDID